MAWHAEYLHPGTFMSESSSITLIGPNMIAEATERAPQSAFAFTVYEVSEAPDLGDEFTVTPKPRNRSGVHYLDADVFTADDIDEMGGHEILLSNMRGNGWERVVRCRTGNWQPLETNDVVISTVNG